MTEEPPQGCFFVTWVFTQAMAQQRGVRAARAPARGVRGIPRSGQHQNIMRKPPREGHAPTALKDIKKLPTGTA